MWSCVREPLFQRWEDPQSGVVSWMLQQPQCGVTQPFYFVTPTVDTTNGRIWFQAAWPPNPSKVLGWVNAQHAEATAQVMPAAAFPSADPLIVADGVLFGSGATLYHMDLAGVITEYWTFPAELLKRNDPLCGDPIAAKLGGQRPVQRLASHLTRTVDGRLILDMVIDDRWFLASLSADKQLTIHREFPSHMDHAQASPHDPNLVLLAQDWTRGPAGVRPFHHRLWLYDLQRDELRPVHAAGDSVSTHRDAHEWWLADGRFAWVNYEDGVFCCDSDGQNKTVIWPGPACHAHASTCGRWWVKDESPYKWPTPCQVILLDTQRHKEFTLCSGMPAPRAGKALYHSDPHPQISPDGRAVLWMSTVTGHTQLAITCWIKQR